ncbi:hypothetical protein NEHOM01_0594 [Nematocida homosporus]|uniref:uncharacterized protein n=1 Tax=Nematocida homosporus TaxID=1912981 RepID=UPI00221E9B56|nr:uncharacterized protein NEHOM01_0594 [Nematocida homosporus]KAI5185089.1 hypothetical protein NEHOM01_0594 [Nematocida homosporus]
MECVKPITAELGIADCLACSGCVGVAEPDVQKHLKGLELIKVCLNKESRDSAKIGVVWSVQSKLALYWRWLNRMNELGKLDGRDKDINELGKLDGRDKDINELGVSIVSKDGRGVGRDGGKEYSIGKGGGSVGGGRDGKEYSIGKDSRDDEVDVNDLDRLGENGWISFREFERRVLYYMQDVAVIDASFGSRRLLEVESMKSGPVVASICPGVVAYAEGTAHHLVPYLSRSWSPMELAAKYWKDKGYTVVAIMMCKDKRMESEWGSVVDYCLTSNDLYTGLFEDLDLPVPPESYQPDSLGMSFPLPGHSSGGLYEGIRDQLDPNSIIAQVSKENYQEVTYQSNNQIRKIAQIHGLPRVVSFATKAKQPAFLKQYHYVELMICRRGCLYGPSQGATVPEAEYAALTSPTISHPNPITKQDAQTLQKRPFLAKLATRKSFAVKW